MRSANPALNNNTFTRYAQPYSDAETMTINGTVNKAGILLILCLMPAAWLWQKFFSAQNPDVVYPYLIGGALGGFVTAMVTVFKKEWAPITAPIYALLEGLVLGGRASVIEVLPLQHERRVHAGPVLVFEVCVPVPEAVSIIGIMDSGQRA